MSLRKNKKGGRDFANVSDNYNLLQDALKQIKGGCSSYADANASYMLTDTKKGGSRRYKKGGNLISSGSSLMNLAKQMSGNNTDIIPVVNNNVVATPATTTTPAVATTTAPAVATATAPVVTKGGKRNGGCGCSATNRKNGGAVELAPFAAAVALMAARYMTDINDMKSISKSIDYNKIRH